ncbi:MAG: helix-turn-helix domain-containing protein [Dehalococcoidia bacterium]|nr:helix-turn-helix domain-containing protein [Dehalococcoidia bacterium]
MRAVSPSTIETLAELEQEMVAARREPAAEAIRDALTALARPNRGWLTTGQAAERLGVTIPTVKNWIRRGTLKGAPVGSRWVVSEESVERISGIRKALGDLDEEGYPTPEEIASLTREARRAVTTGKKRIGGR